MSLENRSGNGNKKEEQSFEKTPGMLHSRGFLFVIGNYSDDGSGRGIGIDFSWIKKMIPEG